MNWRDCAVPPSSLSVSRPTTPLAAWVLGGLGVAAFGLTLPMTTLALGVLDPQTISFTRSAIAGLIALALLWLTRTRRPTRRELGQFAIVALGVVLGFPFLSALAMQSVPAGHGGVVLAILPLMTALAATRISGESPSLSFWAYSLFGALLVIIYSLKPGTLIIQSGDLLLFGAVVIAAVGYALGAELAKAWAGWQVICWSLVVALPVTGPLALIYAPDSSAFTLTHLIPWLAFAYLTLFSQLLGFFVWYKGLAMGGTARVSQVQLLQPFVTLIGAAWLLHEAIDQRSITFAIAVSLVVWAGRNSQIHRNSETKTRS